MHLCSPSCRANLIVCSPTCFYSWSCTTDDLTSSSVVPNRSVENPQIGRFMLDVTNPRRFLSYLIRVWITGVGNDGFANPENKQRPWQPVIPKHQHISEFIEHLCVISHRATFNWLGWPELIVGELLVNSWWVLFLRTSDGQMWHLFGTDSPAMCGNSPLFDFPFQSLCSDSLFESLVSSLAAR